MHYVYHIGLQYAYTYSSDKQSRISLDSQVKNLQYEHKNHLNEVKRGDHILMRECYALRSGVLFLTVSAEMQLMSG